MYAVTGRMVEAASWREEGPLVQHEFEGERGWPPPERRRSEIVIIGLRNRRVRELELACWFLPSCIRPKNRIR